MSSPMMKRMFGRVCCVGCCCASAGLTNSGATPSSTPAPTIALASAALAVEANNRSLSTIVSLVLRLNSRVADHAAKPDMAHAALYHLRMPSGRAVTPAVIGCAQKGATFDDLARDAALRLRWIVA